MDGARLGQGIMAEDSDLSLEDIALLTDVFWIGGTKNGALLGEAIVIAHSAIQEDFAFHIKQRGAMLSKGRILGLQFLELFKDDLFFDLAKYANEQAMKIKQTFIEKDISFWAETTTNQIFPILHINQISQLSQNFSFHHWRKIDEEHSAIRLITSWATNKSSIDTLIDKIVRLK